MLFDGTYFWMLHLILLVFVINTVCTGGGGRSGEHVHIKLHIPQVYKKHTHVQTIVKHHFHPAPQPKQKKVHHYHHHQHAHKSKSKTNSHFHFESLPVHSATQLSHSHYEIPTYKPKKLSTIYSTDYHLGGGGYKSLKSGSIKLGEESFRPSLPVYAMDEDEHMPEYGFHHDDSHADEIMEDPENEYDETKTTSYYSAPSLGQQPLHTSFQSSASLSDALDAVDGTSQWDGLLSKKFKSSDIKLESPSHGLTWPMSMPSELESYSTVAQFSKPSVKKIPKFVYDSENYEVGYTDSDFAKALVDVPSGSSSKIIRKWPNTYSTRFFAKQNYED